MFGYFFFYYDSCLVRIYSLVSTTWHSTTGVLLFGSYPHSMHKYICVWDPHPRQPKTLMYSTIITHTLCGSEIGSLTLDQHPIGTYCKVRVYIHYYIKLLHWLDKIDTDNLRTGYIYIYTSISLLLERVFTDIPVYIIYRLTVSTLVESSVAGEEWGLPRSPSRVMLVLWVPGNNWYSLFW